MEYDTMIPRRVERIPAPSLHTGHDVSVALPRVVTYDTDRTSGINVSSADVVNQGPTHVTDRHAARRTMRAKRPFAKISNVNELFVPLFVAAAVVYIYVSATGTDVRTFARAEGSSYDPEGRRTSIFTWVDISIAATLCFFFMSRIRNFF